MYCVRAPRRARSPADRRPHLGLGAIAVSASRRTTSIRALLRARYLLLAGALLGGYALYRSPPLEHIARQEVGLRVNRWTGATTLLGEGPALLLPGLHELRRFPLQDRLFQPQRSARADGEAPLQSIEGLSLGVEISIRYALDPQRVTAISARDIKQLEQQLVEPLVQGVIYKVIARYSVREIFTGKRVEVQQALHDELQPLLAADGLLLRSVLMGNIDLPPDYRAGMDQLLAMELETQKMAHTLTLKEQQVKESALQADADKMRREKAAEAAANEQIIAARGQQEAMKHVLPFKQRQIEQRQLEADADKAQRIRQAEATAEARRIEAIAEAESRRKLADAEAYRLEQLGRVNSEQMARDGALVSQYPLLIQKTLADKLSDKVSVIIAAPPSDGGFIGANLVGTANAAGGQR